MSEQDQDDLSSMSMLDLFRDESESQAAIIITALLELERAPAATHHLEALMRAAHSLKGAARIVNQESAVSVAHGLEDCFVAAQQGRIQLRQAEIDTLFQGVDLLLHLSESSLAEVAQWELGNKERIQDFLATLSGLVAAGETQVLPATIETTPPALVPHSLTAGSVVTEAVAVPLSTRESSGRVLKLTAENVNRLLGLAGEALVESRWLHPFADSMLRLKRLQSELVQSLEGLRESLQTRALPETVSGTMNEVIESVMECRQLLSDRLVDLEMYDRRSSNLSHRLYLEVLACRMRPFGDGVRRFPRMVRDLARRLGKQIRLEMVGENTQVDREILDKLETPLTHLLRNAVDHGCEAPEERRRAGKPGEATIRLEARHTAGMLVITVADDGAGIPPETLRETIVRKRLTSQNVAEKLSEAELLEFLLLPGFTMRDTVTELSGRGVGLDVVQTMVKSVHGSIRIATFPGKGMRFQLQLPLTLSVLRTLLVEIAEEPYAIPLAQISRTLKLPREKIEELEGRHHFRLGDTQVGLLTAHQVLDCDRGARWEQNELPVVVLGDSTAQYGLVVDRFLGERELVVQTLDPGLGKVKDITAGALMEDGTPVLIVDVEDLIRSIEKLLLSGGLDGLAAGREAPVAARRKRILAVDDSLTVRELERKLLVGHGYLADVAVDGMDGWNAVRDGNYDLVITDVDMPRMDGIQLATLIKQDPRLKSVPVVIVSYKDREADRLRGLEAGADYYLTKGSFHDEALLRAVTDLIGGAEG